MTKNITLHLILDQIPVLQIPKSIFCLKLFLVQGETQTVHTSVGHGKLLSLRSSPRQITLWMKEINGQTWYQYNSRDCTASVGKHESIFQRGVSITLCREKKIYFSKGAIGQIVQFYNNTKNPSYWLAIGPMALYILPSKSLRMAGPLIGCFVWAA